MEEKEAAQTSLVEEAVAAFVVMPASVETQVSVLYECAATNVASILDSLDKTWYSMVNGGGDGGGAVIGEKVPSDTITHVASRVVEARQTQWSPEQCLAMKSGGFMSDKRYQYQANMLGEEWVPKLFQIPEVGVADNAERLLDEATVLSCKWQDAERIPGVLMPKLASYRAVRDAHEKWLEELGLKGTASIIDSESDGVRRSTISVKRATSPPPTRRSASASMYCAVLYPASARAAVSLSHASIVAGARGIYGIGSGNELSTSGQYQIGTA